MHEPAPHVPSPFGPSPTSAATTPAPGGKPGRRRGWGRALLVGTMVALLGFAGGVGGYFAADAMDEDGGGSAAASFQPANPAPAQSSGTRRTTAESGGLTPREIYEQVSPAVVHINSTVRTTRDFFGIPQESEQRGAGSGFVIDTKGHIVTNAHVVDGAEELTVSFGDDVEVPAKLVGEDASTDIAVIKVDPDAKELGGKLRTVPFGDSTQVQVGDPVVAIGNPYSLDRTLTTGVVSALQRNIPAFNDDYEISDVIQTDAAINPGNSGGPLLDMNGNVIGVNSQIRTTGDSTGFIGIAFAVPSSTVRDIAAQLIDTGEVRHAWLGVRGGDLTPELAKALNLDVEEGVLIGDVTEGSPADEAGIEGGEAGMVIEGTSINPGGDVILAFDGKRVTTMRELSAAVSGKQPGDKVKLQILKDGDRETVELDLGTRPQESEEE